MAPATPANLYLTLKRTYYPDGVNGAIYTADHAFICDTIELPWKDNKRQVSCIKECIVELRPRYNARHGKHLEVVGEPGRGDVLFHTANRALTELRGKAIKIVKALKKWK